MNKKPKKFIAAAVSFSAALNLTACVYGPPPGEEDEIPEANVQSMIISDSDSEEDEEEFL